MVEVVQATEKVRKKARGNHFSTFARLSRLVFSASSSSSSAPDSLASSDSESAVFFRLEPTDVPDLGLQENPNASRLPLPGIFFVLALFPSPLAAADLQQTKSFISTHPC